MEALAKTFIAAEDKSLISLQGASQSSAELVPAKRRIGALSEEIAGVQNIVSQEFEQVAMQLIGSRHCDHADLPSRAFAVFSAVGVFENIEFADGVNAQQQAAYAARHHIGG